MPPRGMGMPRPGGGRPPPSSGSSSSGGGSGLVQMSAMVAVCVILILITFALEGGEWMLGAAIHNGHTRFAYVGLGGVRLAAGPRSTGHGQAGQGFVRCRSSPLADVVVPLFMSVRTYTRTFRVPCHHDHRIACVFFGV